MSTTEAQKAASIRYAAKALKQIKINLHRENDADIIKKLEACGNVQGYIKELIRRDIEKKA